MTDRRVVGFVATQHAWVKALFQGLREERIPVNDLVLADGGLRAYIGSESVAPLTLTVQPRRDDAPGWATTRKYTIGFEGPREPAPRQRTVLSRARKVLTRLDGQMPAQLRGFAAIIRPGENPIADLGKLFPFLDVESSVRNGTQRLDEVLVRVTAACNQRCPFCAAPDHDQPSKEVLLACFSAVSQLLPGATLTLTGGEPSLRPDFIEELTTARALPGVERIVVQTNAVLFAELRDPAALPSGPDLNFFVSLHAVEPSIYDACTGSKGMLPDALRGIRRILAAGHDVTLNTVVTVENANHVEDMVRQLPSLFPGDPDLTLHFSSLMCPEWRPEARSLLIPYAKLAKVLERAAAVAEEVGLRTDTVKSATHASMPLCTLPEGVDTTGPRPSLDDGETGYETADTPYVKAETCKSCSETDHCLGVPRAYAQRFGLEELVPLRLGAR